MEQALGAHSAEIDFAQLFQARSTMYAYATIESPAAMTVPALLGFGGRACSYQRHTGLPA
jgi:hypothetical protein